VRRLQSESGRVSLVDRETSLTPIKTRSGRSSRITVSSSSRSPVVYVSSIQVPPRDFSSTPVQRTVLYDTNYVAHLLLLEVFDTGRPISTDRSLKNYKLSRGGLLLLVAILDSYG
jgi:hypothetical protein